MMTVSDQHIAFLRSYLRGDEEAATRSWERIESRAGLAALVHAAFVIAARQKFAPSWTRAAVIRYVANIRAQLSERPDILDPRAAEHELRLALGDKTTAAYSPASVAAAQLIMLSALLVSLDLDEVAVDDLLRQARETTERLLARQAFPTDLRDTSGNPHPSGLFERTVSHDTAGHGSPASRAYVCSIPETKPLPMSYSRSLVLRGPCRSGLR